MKLYQLDFYGDTIIEAQSQEEAIELLLRMLNRRMVTSLNAHEVRVDENGEYEVVRHQEAK